MKVTSNYNGTVFWRSFTKEDTVYIIGLKQGTVKAGGTFSYDNPTGFFQIELKVDGLFGQTLVSAGHVYTNDDEYILGADGQFISIQDATKVTIDDQESTQAAGPPLWEFFDQGDDDSEITVTSTIELTVTNTGESQATVTNEATDETGAQVGAKESVGGGTGKLGVDIDEGLSSKVTDKVSEVVNAKTGFSVVSKSTYTESQQIKLPAKKLTSIETSWQRQNVTGSATVGTNTYPFTATIRLFSSRAVLNWDSPDDLPADAMAAYMKLNPGYRPPIDLHDGAVVREQDNAPVYVIFGGAKFWIPDPAVLNSLYGGWGNVVVVPDGSLNAVPSVPRDGTILRENDHPEVWLIEAGGKRHITSPDVLGRYGGWPVVHIVPDDATADFPTGTPVT